MRRAKRIVSVWLVVMLAMSGLSLAPAGAQEGSEPSDEELPLLPFDPEMEELFEEFQEELMSDLPTEDATDIVINEALESQPSLLQLDEIVQADVDIVDGELIADLGSADDSIQIVRSLSNRRAKASNSERAKVEDNGVEVVVESTHSSLRIMEVISARNQRHKFDYSVTINGEAAHLTLAEDGSVTVSNRELVFGEEGFTVFGVIEAPWAVDSDGNSVGAKYDITANGRNLRMTVDKAPKSAYPLVADPTYSTRYGKFDCFWNCSYYFDGIATRWLRQRRGVNSNELTNLAIGLICGGVAVGAPGFVGAIIGAACGVYLGYHANAIRTELGKASYWATDQCLVAKFHPARVVSTLHWTSTTTSHEHCHYNL